MPTAASPSPRVCCPCACRRCSRPQVQPRSHLSPNPKPQTTNPKPQTPNPKPQTPNPKPQTPNRIQVLEAAFDIMISYYQLPHAQAIRPLRGTVNNYMAHAIDPLDASPASLPEHFVRFAVQCIHSRLRDQAWDASVSKFDRCSAPSPTLSSSLPHPLPLYFQLCVAQPDDHALGAHSGEYAPAHVTPWGGAGGQAGEGIFS